MNYSDIDNMDYNLVHFLFIQATKWEQQSAEQAKHEKNSKSKQSKQPLNPMQMEAIQEAIREGVFNE